MNIFDWKIFKWIALKRYNWKKYDFFLIGVIVVLVGISTFILSKVAPSFSVSKQIIGLIFGFIVMAVVSVIDYHTICQYIPFFYIIGTLMVAATRFSPIGTDLNTGSFRWLDLKVINFQPSELVKVILIVTLAAFFNRYMMREDKKINSWKTFFIACGITIIPTGFILVQSDLSSSIVIFMVLAIMLISSGVGAKILGPVAGIVIPSIGVLFWYIQQPNQKLLNEYQVDRILGFLHPEEAALGTMFQQNNSVLSIASGKLYGKMIADTGDLTRNYNNVSVRDSDFVWTPIGEEFGFIGCLIIIALLSVLIFKCFIVAKHSRDYLGMMIAIGIGAMYCFQIFFNIGVATSILPNTGLPLPFLSNGLTSFWSNMISIGILLNIGIQPQRRRTAGDADLYKGDI
ncbi:MAG: rod shape-determining protein RodA [Eubacterium sp.]|nr:rod shape-determining protein RodA [Eubacterium sp.]